MVFPATACLIQDDLGLSSTWGFDLSAACSGFLYAMTTGAQFIASGAHARVVVVGSDLMSATIDPLDRTTAVLFGDGAGAVLLEPAEPGFGILDFHHRVDGSGRNDLLMPAGGSLRPASHETVERREHFLRQNGWCQVRGVPDGGVRAGTAGAERAHAGGPRHGGAASG
jgi:3-oxoacyl-[acyl-carrier-protein] synthase-3